MPARNTAETDYESTARASVKISHPVSDHREGAMTRRKATTDLCLTVAPH
jgi:hypothetical protein